MKNLASYSIWLLAIVGIGAGIEGITGVDYIDNLGPQLDMIIDVLAGIAGLMVVYGALTGKKSK